MIPHPFRGLTLVVVAATCFLSLVLGPSFQTSLLQPVFFGIVLTTVSLLPLVREGWLVLAVVGLCALALGPLLWIGVSWGYGTPDAIPPRTEWIQSAIQWLLLTYCLTVAGFLAGIGQIRRGEASLDARWIYVVFVPAALAVLLLQGITALDAYNYPG